jgi:hypothetical protein
VAYFSSRYDPRYHRGGDTSLKILDSFNFSNRRTLVTFIP